MEKTLVLIKPDAFGKNHAGDILKIYEDAGFKIIAAKVMKMTEELAAKHYVEHIGRPYYPALVEFMTSAPIMALVLGGDGVIKKVRELNGATNPTPKTKLKMPFTPPTALKVLRGKFRFSSARAKCLIKKFYPRRKLNVGDFL